MVASKSRSWNSACMWASNVAASSLIGAALLSGVSILDPPIPPRDGRSSFRVEGALPRRAALARYPQLRKIDQNGRPRPGLAGPANQLKPRPSTAAAGRAGGWDQDAARRKLSI